MLPVKRPMARLLVILPNLDAGGAERSLTTLLQLLPPHFECHVALVHSHRKQLLGAVVDRVSLHDLRGSLRMLWRLPMLVWRIRPTWILSTPWDVNVVVLLLRFTFPRRTKVIAREAVMPFSGIVEKKFKKIWSLLYRLTYRLSNAIVVLTPTMKAVMQEKMSFPSMRVHVIPNAVLADRCASPAVNVSRERLVAVGRLSKQKGYDLLIRSLRIVIESEPKVTLEIYGEGDRRTELQNLVNELSLDDRVRFMGHVDNPVPLISTAAFLVSCSYYEGLSNAVLEALCAGVPVIAVAGSTSAQDIIESGVNGFLIDGYDVSTIARRIVEAIRMSSGLDRAAIAASARKAFGPEAHLRRYISIFESF